MTRTICFADFFRRNVREFALLLLFVFAAALGAQDVSKSPDYSQAENWAVRDSAETGDWDVFYICPTLTSSLKKPLMDWSDPKTEKKVRDFAEAQTRGIFQADARVFAPFVRQLEYTRCAGALRNKRIPPEQTEMKHGIRDTLDAFDWYLRNVNGGRPFILLGHSQGAVDLYCLLKNRKDMSPEKGFVAAYLIGLSRVTEKDFARDFPGRAVHPAKGADDLGAVVVWNTQAPSAKNPFFTEPGTLCINPLNWRTGPEPAGPEENLGAVFYDYRTGKTERIAHFCGARVDPAKGALIVDLPVRSKYDAAGFMGAGVFHMNDIWFFAENLRANAKHRVELWRRSFERKNPANGGEK